MKILFLGTGAADWAARHKDMPYYRRNASVLVDDCLLIDPGPNVIEAINTFSVDVAKIKYILNTHRHSDHYDAETVAFLQSNGAKYIEAHVGEEINVGKYSIKAVAANHPVPTLHYLIFDGEKRMFYGLDGGWLMYDEVQAIKDKGVDFAVLDATAGFIDGDYRVFEHNNLNMIIEIKKSLSNHIKRFCISHMARTLHTDHQSLANEMQKYGIEVAYDGLQIEF